MIFKEFRLRRSEFRQSPGRERVPDPDDPMGIWIRKRSQQERIDNTEDCCRCANAKREGENRDASESWGFAQHAQAEAQILNEILNPIYASRVTTFFFGLF